MGQISFTANLQRHVACASMPVVGATVREALDHVFTQNAPLRAYILDDQGRLRRHINIFVNGVRVRDRLSLSDAISADDQIHVFQALSGG
jgi:sulfur-carrier protein